MSLTRNKQFNLKFTEHEWELVQQRMKLCGMTNTSAYLRKIAINGMIVNVDMTELKEMLRLQNRTAANVNQIAIRCHETDNLYAEDMDELNAGYHDQTEQMKKLVEQVATLRGCF